MHLAFYFVCGFFFAWAPLAGKQLSVNVRAESALLINADTGAVLYEKNAHKPMFPASTTKIATALYTLHLLGDRLGDIVTADGESLGWVSDEAKKKSNYTIPSYKLEPGGTHMGIKKGEQLSLKELLYGLLLVSANDAANVIASYAEGSIPQFVTGLNGYLKEIGCKETNFTNPHGLHDPKHSTTAHDLAIMAKEALKQPFFRDAVATVRHTRPKTNKQDPAPLLQSNRLLRSGKHFYAKAIGVKTGTTSIAQNNIVAAAKDGNRTLIAVLLKNPDRSDMFDDAITLFEAAFKQPKLQKTLVKAGPQSIERHFESIPPVPTYISENVVLDYYAAEEPNLRCLLTWEDISPPIKSGQKIGELSIETTEGKQLRKVPLLAGKDVDSSWLQATAAFFGSPNAPGNGLKLLGGMACIFVLFGFGRQLFRR